MKSCGMTDKRMHESVDGVHLSNPLPPSKRRRKTQSLKKTTQPQRRWMGGGGDRFIICLVGLLNRARVFQTPVGDANATNDKASHAKRPR